MGMTMFQEKLARREQELWRANTYQLLAQLLMEPPSQRLVDHLRKIPPLHSGHGEDAVALAWVDLGDAARRSNEALSAAEFHAIFDENSGLLVPYASWYVAGERNAKPLSLLRAEMAALGIVKSGELSEDHASQLCQMMCLLIESEDPRQIGFFTRHIKPWLPQFFHDLSLSPSAFFYRPVGSLGESFIEVERIFLRETY
jgi:TorA maturation chaperone TorD